MNSQCSELARNIFNHLRNAKNQGGDSYTIRQYLWKLCLRGVPTALRYHIWSELCDVRALMFRTVKQLHRYE